MPSKIKKATIQEQVDLRVTQELKNHADFVDRINRSVQRLSDEVINLSGNAKEVFSKFQSEKKSLEIIFHGLDCKTKERLEGFQKSLDEFRDTLKHDISKISLSVSSVKDKATRMDFLESYFDQLDKSQRDLEDKFKNIIFIVNAHIDDFTKMCEKFFEKKKLEFITQIPCIKHLEKILDDKLQEIDVNQKGMQKEIEIIKKSVQYGEKKFENIYTLLERLKAGK